MSSTKGILHKGNIIIIIIIIIICDDNASLKMWTHIFHFKNSQFYFAKGTFFVLLLLILHYIIYFRIQI
jgi:hypothetical protein